MMWSILLYALFSGLTALSTGFVMLCVMRFLTGLALGSEWSTGVALVSETWPENARTKGLGFLQSGFGWGSLVASLVWFVLSATHPFGDESWRLVFLVGAFPALVVLYIRRGLDESEKWQRAVREKRWVATQIDGQTTASNTGTSGKRPFTLKQLFTEPTALRYILIFIVLGIVTNVGFWAIATWLPGTTAGLAKAAGAANPGQWAAAEAILYTLGSIVAYVLAGFIIDVIGRRWFVCLSFVGGLAITYVTYRMITTAVGMEIAAPINGFFTLGCAYVWITIYPCEVFTSTVRTSALSAIFSGSRFVAWFFPIIAGSLIAFFGGTSNLAVTVGSVFVLGIILPWFLPETKGKGMPA
jgi:MFS family permease